MTLTWSNVNLNTPDNYYYFVQENSDAFANANAYVEYDFEGYKLYRSYVGASDAHSELIYQCSLSDGNLAFSYTDDRTDDESYLRMRNGMKVWYALVPYDKNYDPSTAEEFSLPAEDQSKVWNRTAPEGYYTVRPRSDASNYVGPALTGDPVFSPAGTAEALTVTSVDLAGDGNGNLTEAPKYLEPLVEFTLTPVLAEKITSQLTVSIRCGRRDAVEC